MASHPLKPHKDFHQQQLHGQLIDVHWSKGGKEELPWRIEANLHGGVLSVFLVCPIGDGSVLTSRMSLPSRNLSQREFNSIRDKEVAQGGQATLRVTLSPPTTRRP